MEQRRPARSKANKVKNETTERLIFSEKFACPVSGFTIPEIEPRLFSFNNPFGACPACGGLGVEQHIDADLVIPDKDRTLRGGAIAPWAKSSSPYYIQTLQALGKHYKFTLDTKWKDLPKKTQDAILYGSGDDAIKFTYDDGMRSYQTTKPFEGVVTNLERRWKETESDWAREEMAKYFTDIPCAACNGNRLKPEALCVKIAGRHIGEVAEMSVKGAGEWFTDAAEGAHAQAERDRGARAQGDPRPAQVPGRRRARISHARARHRHAVGRREPAHPARLADRLRADRRALRARRALDRAAPARQCAAARNAEAAARPRQHRDRGRARRGRHPHRRPRARHRPRRRHPRRPHRGAGQRRRHHRHAELAHRQISLGRADRADSRAAAEELTPHAEGRQRPRQQSQERHRRDPARPVHLRHRRLGRRQVDAAGRHALQGDRAQAQRRARGPCPARPHRGPRAPRQGDRHRPVADRAHAALEPGHLYRRVHADPRMVRRPARGQGARLRARPLLVQRQGRALRGLPGRRRDQDRDALPAGRLRHLRRLQGQALQPRDARGARSRTSRSPTCST